MQIKILSQLILNWIDKVKKTGLLAIYHSQKKRIVFSALILILSLTYFLSRNAIRRLKADTLYWEEQSSLAKNLLPKVKSEQEVINLLKQQAQVSHRLIMLPTRQNILQAVKDYAQRMNIRIVNIVTDAEQQPRHNDTNVVLFNCRPVSTLAVVVEAEAGYENLARYFDTLYRVAPTCVSVEWLKIDKDKRNSDRLKVVMELRFYGLL